MIAQILILIVFLCVSCQIIKNQPGEEQLFELNTIENLRPPSPPPLTTMKKYF